MKNIKLKRTLKRNSKEESLNIPSTISFKWNSRELSIDKDKYKKVAEGFENENN
ncbi:MAG: hypothetical protein KAJ58_00730 [Candidatus Pacebacteria bacterium]|nr:hypothetical protein [Candidatus Paceibacterota bacterium]